MSEQTRIDMAVTGREWAERGFSCELWVDPPGQVWSDFVHDVDELLLMQRGSIVLEMHGRVLRLDPGDEITIPAGTRHTVRNVGDGAARWLYGYRRSVQSSET
ncbi:MAG TPA: cupin domain-containing protein [Planctomycetota bacterium]|nr:cupin domain-containing protein [Planctomycetota bacterium]